MKRIKEMFKFLQRKKEPEQLKPDLYGTNEFRTYISAVGAHLGEDFIDASNANHVNAQPIGGYLKHFVFDCFMNDMPSEECAEKIKAKFSTMFMI